MLVSDIVTDLAAAIEQFPRAADWRVSVASYAEGPGNEINVMYVSAFDADDYQDFSLVPEGMGEHLGIEEKPLTARALLAALESNPEWASFAAYATAEAIRLPDGRVVSANQPLWGTGVQESAQLVYFYYGASGSEA